MIGAVFFAGLTALICNLNELIKVALISSFDDLNTDVA